MSANRFRVRTVALCGSIALVAAGLATASVLQPPRLTGLDYSAAALTETTDARLVLRLNQSVATLRPADVSVDRDLPVTVTTDGATVTVRLGGRLDYGSTLRLRVRVAGQATGATADIDETIRVRDPRVYTLVRHEQGDRLIGNDLVSGAAPSELNTHLRVQEYAALGDRVFTVSDAGGGAVEFGEFAERGEPGESGPRDGLGGAGDPSRSYHPLIPASDGALSHLRADPAGQFVGVVADGVPVAGRSTARELLLMDARSGVAPPTAVSGQDGTPFAVEDWRFVPGGLAVVVRTTANELWFAAPALGREPVRLGDAEGIAGVLPGTGEVVALRGGEAVALDVSGLVAGGAAGLAAERSLGRASVDRVFVGDGGGVFSVVRSGDGGRLLAGDEPGSDPGADPGGAVFFAPADERSRIGAVCPAPNGTVIAVEVVSADAVSDGRPVRPGFLGTTTAYLDARTGELLRSAIGFAPDWC